MRVALTAALLAMAIPVAAQRAGQPVGTIRFQGMDTNNDGRITREVALSLAEEEKLITAGA